MSDWRNVADCTSCVTSSNVSVVTGVEVAIMHQKGVSFAQFFYRVNPDNTIESICGFCFMASAASDSQSNLQAWESAHRCLERQQKIA
jgi:hypothetical protein